MTQWHIDGCCLSHTDLLTFPGAIISSATSTSCHSSLIPATPSPDVVLGGGVIAAAGGGGTSSTTLSNPTSMTSELADTSSLNVHKAVMLEGTQDTM